MQKLGRSLLLAVIYIISSISVHAQINTDQVMRIGQNNLYFEDYVLSIQYFNQVINVKPHLARPYFLRAIAKLNLDDYQGAESDATLALERNPFIVDAWEVRGVARQNLGKDKEAIEDYDKALEMLPESRGLLYNKAVAQHNMKDMDGAKSTFGQLLDRYPNFEGGYLGRARLRLEEKDTVGALSDIDRALDINKNAVNGYIMRADIAINGRKDYKSALEDMDNAIRLQPQYAGFFINRAFLRYATDDFQGAFADYDYALQLEPQNTMALFNRGILRAEVHDTNKAIDDFSTVLGLDPYDYKALYNRSMLLAEIGDFDGAIADLDKVISAYPDFAAAYFVRFDVKRRKGDMTGAEKDYNKSLALAKTEVQVSAEDRFSPPARDTDGDGTGSTSTETQEEVKRRFSSLNTIADNSSPEQIFNSKDIRGKVQDRNVTVELEPMFAVTYYTSPTELKLSGDYVKEVDDINATRMLRFILQVTNHEPSMSDEDAASAHFSSINYYNSYIASHAPRAIDYFGRAMDFMTLRDYDNAIADLDRAIALTPDFTLAYLVRASARHKKSILHKDKTDRHEQMAQTKMVVADLDTVIKLSPVMPIAWYNKGVALAAEGDYTSALQAFNRALELRPDFGEAYFNRGYVYLYLGNREAAFSDLSRAGSLGIVPSYNLLKRMSAK